MQSNELVKQEVGNVVQSPCQYWLLSFSTTKKFCTYACKPHWQWRSQGGQVASGEGILGGPPPNFYAVLDFSNGLEHNWGGGGPPPLLRH